MSFLNRYWSELQQAWESMVVRPPRSQRLISRPETLEIRRLLTSDFTDLGASNLPNLRYSSVAWGDYDSDGDLDLLVTGKETSNRVSKIFRNDSGTFTDINASLTSVYRSAVAWGDYDNDGDLDILLTGVSSSGYISKVYRNDSGLFTDINAGLTGVKSSGGQNVAWGDYDNDGDLDIALTGSISPGNYTSKIYRNENGSFVDINAGLTAVSLGSAEWGDYDNDGDLDLVISGGTSGGSGRVALIYRNSGGTFTNINAGQTGTSLGTAAWGDYDNDGDLDLLVAGNTGSGKIAKIYQNNSGVFSDISAGLTGVDFSSAAWGDYDNDGDLDLLLTGRDGGNTKISRVYRNNAGTFSDIIAGLAGVYDGSVAWGDYDNDGDLDLLLTGDAGSFTSVTHIYRNNSSTANTVPAAPSGLTGTSSSTTSLTFSWTGPADGQTATAGLSYNLRVGTSPGASDVYSTMSNPSTGKRLIAERGPIEGTSFTLTGLTPGTTYYWSVQAIDTALAGSTFATEATATTARFTDLGALGITGLFTRAEGVDWGDFDNDGDLDVVISGSGSGNTPFTAIYRNDAGMFTDISAGLTGLRNSTARWGDFDNDGNLDMFLSGRDSSGTSVSRLYRNDNGNFVEVPTGIAGANYGSADWGDYDHDGDLDLVLGGQNGSNVSFTSIYRNNGDGTFTDIAAGLAGASFSSVAWGDYDADGDLDLLISGTNGGLGRVTKVYRNDSGSFTDISASIVPVNNSSVAWGDYDNDGDLDLLIAGQDGGGVPGTRIYQNNGNNTFTDIGAGLTGVFYGSVAWGDVDNDGDLDAIISGRTQTSDRIAKVFLNNAGIFTVVSSGLSGVDFSSIAAGDYDGDGDLDLLLIGRPLGINSMVANLYRNDGTTANTVPAAPGNLVGTASSSTSVTFSWTGPTDTQTPTAGLSYNLRVGTTPGGSDIYTTMADSSTGKRLIASSGPIQGTSFTLTGLTPGTTYYWSVQAIDTAFAGSAFAAEATAKTSRFTDLGSLGITGLLTAPEGVAWGDFDNDGDLDVVIAGSDNPISSFTAIYRNDGGVFTDINAGLTQIRHSTASWGDYDNDGDLDLFLSGRDSTDAFVSRLYRNDNGAFVQISTGITGVRFSSSEWGDFDNDGDLDLLLGGIDGSNVISTSIYRNKGDGTFTDIAAGLPGETLGSVAWGDYDADGDLDVLISGSGSAGRVTRVYRNDNGSFTNISANLPIVTASSVAWGDYDNDGDLDFLISGYDRYANVWTQIYRNDGNDTFTDIGAGLAEVFYGSVAWGDVDNDGDLDAIISGRTKPSGRVAKVYLNNAGTFTEESSALTGVEFSSVKTGDYDGDGDLDLLIVGQLAGGNTLGARVYRNDGTAANTVPAAPGNLTGTVASSTSVTFSWSGPSDSQTPTAGLSYNLRVGTTPGGSDVYASMADSSTGLRRIASRGMIQGTSLTLTGLTPGITYYWSVQAIDTALAGSPFAAEESIAINTIPVLAGAVANQAVNDNATISPFTTFTVTDPDSQSLSALVNIHNGTNRGDFTAASTAGWTRTVVGTEIRYTRTFPAGAGSDATVQAAIRALVFQPRQDAILPNTTETTEFTVGVSDGIATPVMNSDTTVITTSLNDLLAVAGGTSNQTVSEGSTIAPFTSITVTDPDTQDLFVRVTILNGVYRGDFTAASTIGWTRTVAGNNILFDRYYSPSANIGATAQADIQALVFQARSGAINPGTSEETDFLVYVTDGITDVTNSNTSTITTTINTAPTIGGANSMVVVNDNATVNPFSTLTVTDPDTQEMLITVTILNGVVRGDFTNANSGTGWTVREVVGNNITYKQYLSPRANVGGDAQAAFRALIFQPRSNSIPVGATEITDFQVTVSDGVAAAVANSETRVTTTSLNETPTDIGLSSNSIAENTPNGTIGLLSTTDPDLGDMFTYSIQPGGNGSQFVISGNTLKVGATGLDFEAGATRSITIRTTDKLGEFFDKVFSIDVLDLQEAPVLAKSPFPSIPDRWRKSETNDGATVANIIASVLPTELITDQDAGSLKGFAVVDGTNANGTWQYSTDGGQAWNSLADTSLLNARLLDESALIRFVPLKKKFKGDVSLQVVAWDQTSGTNGGVAEVVTRGGSTAFSTDVTVVRHTVTKKQTAV